jgi:hypothetical protein
MLYSVLKVYYNKISYGNVQKEKLLWTTKQFRENKLCNSLGSFLPERTLCIVDLNLNLLSDQ